VHEDQGRGNRTNRSTWWANYERPIHSPLEILPALYTAKFYKGQPNPEPLAGLFETGNDQLLQIFPLGAFL
jgi:hypothetical protein